VKVSHDSGSDEESNEESSAGEESTDSREVEVDSVESFFSRQQPIYTSPLFPPAVDAYNEDEVRHMRQLILFI